MKGLSFEGHTRFVQVNNKRLNVAVFGDARDSAPKLVFLSGAGTASPLYDFKALIEELGDRFCSIVLEKSGYGFSDGSRDSRDIDTMLGETRAALAAAGVDGPYVLLPHSMSGLEALYWAKRYPSEVEAIIGLDMAMPEAYETRNLVPPAAATALLGALCRLGLPRLLPALTADQSPAIKAGHLTNAEKKTYRALFYKNFMGSDIRCEINTVTANAKTVAAAGLPNVKMLQLVSNGHGTGFSKQEWHHLQESFQHQQGNSQIQYFEAPHYLHDYVPKAISTAIISFLSQLEREQLR
ncbi:alpha/beta hydrolase [Bombiscardovia apis]|uniref:Alpha/beta hydrolase n=1 Tax=Bombiscardovia apis TaxID=2932182 RepID=A0ABM8BCR3_9BIFI|nr:alpha/beta hydrolase [Bombiscardovia apis]